MGQFFRLVILMAMGLGAMYMMHLLAQDFNRIRKPVQQATRILTGASAALMRGKRETTSLGDENATTSINATSAAINWKRILSRDPFECLQSLICQIMSGAERNSHEAIMLMEFLESSLNVAPAKIGRAFSRGLALHDATYRCFDEYPFCIYSAKTMLRILNWFSDTNYAP